MLAAWSGGAVWAQAPQSLTLRISPMLAEEISVQARQNMPAFTASRRLEAQPNAAILLEGDVEVRRADMVIRADRIEYDQARDLIRAEGQARINQAGNLYEGTGLELRLDAGQGFFERARYELLSSQGYGEAERIEFLDETRTVIRNVTFTTCRREPGPDWMPAWLMRAATMRIDSEEEDAEAEDVVLRFQDVPVFAMPVMGFSLTSRRRSGFLSPVFGVDNVSGFEITQPYYWDIAPNRDLTLVPTWMSRRGVNYGGEFRYLESNYSGQLRVDYMPDDKLRTDRNGEPLDRQGVAFEHSGQVSGESWGRLGLNLEYNRASDDNYWRDFSGGASSLTQRLLPASAGVSWQFGPWSADLRSQQWQTLQDPEAPIRAPYDRLPQMTLRYAEPDAAGFDFRLELDSTQFAPSADELDADRRESGAQRSVARAQLAYPMRSLGGFLIPKASWQAVRYEFETPLTTAQPFETSNSSLSDNRTFAEYTAPTWSLDAGLVFERESSFLGLPYSQTLEPRLFYTYTPYVEQNHLPSYDSGPVDFSASSIYSEHSFVGYDRVADNDLLTMGLTTRFIDGETGAEVVQMGAAQRLRFSDQQVVLPGGSPSLAGFSDVLFNLGMRLEPRFYIDSTVQYNQETEESERVTLDLRYQPRPFRLFNVGYRMQRLPEGSLYPMSELIDMGWQWPLNDLWGDRGENLGPGQGEGPGRWYSIGRMNYSTQDQRMVDMLMGFEYDAGCWLGRIVVERLQTGLAEDDYTQRIMFQIELVGFSRIGIDPMDTLRKHLPQYQRLRGQAAPPSRFSNYD